MREILKALCMAIRNYLNGINKIKEMLKVPCKDTKNLLSKLGINKTKEMLRAL